MSGDYGAFRNYLLGRPSVVGTWSCTVCGRPAWDAHHVVQKGMGGVSAAVDSMIPKVRLCGRGNEDGCHGLLHARRLHIYWEGGRPGAAKPGWVFYITQEPMDDLRCWEENRANYLPLPGASPKPAPITFGYSGTSARSLRG